jgi:hypothetical protein
LSRCPTGGFARRAQLHGFLLLNSIIFAYFRLQPSELNGVFNFVETTPPPPPPNFLIGKIGSGLMFGLSGLDTGSVVK